MDSLSALSNSFDNDHFDTSPHPSSSRQQYHQGEHAPAYRLLLSRNLLVSKHRKESFDDIFLPGDLEPNSSHAENFQKRWRWGVYWTPGCGLIVYVSTSCLRALAICSSLACQLACDTHSIYLPKVESHSHHNMLHANTYPIHSSMIK